MTARPPPQLRLRQARIRVPHYHQLFILYTYTYNTYSRTPTKQYLRRQRISQLLTFFQFPPPLLLHG